MTARPAQLLPPAVLSPCGTYRYLLTRQLGDGPPVVFVLLNPSTADASTDDATIRRCRRFAVREGAGVLVVINLFAYRATRPADLLRAADPIGPGNDRFIREHVQPGRLVIAGWGAPGRYRDRGAAVAAMLTRAGVNLACLGVTFTGQPRHPLYLRADAPLVPYLAAGS